MMPLYTQSILFRQPFTLKLAERLFALWKFLLPFGIVVMYVDVIDTEDVAAAAADDDSLWKKFDVDAARENNVDDADVSGRVEASDVDVEVAADDVNCAEVNADVITS